MALRHRAYRHMQSDGSLNAGMSDPGSLLSPSQWLSQACPSSAHHTVFMHAALATLCMVLRVLHQLDDSSHTAMANAIGFQSWCGACCKLSLTGKNEVLEIKLAMLLQAYLCKLGFARFCNIKYTAANSAEADISNPYVHLTNVSIQRRGEEYNESHGNKWPLACLLAWLQVGPFFHLFPPCCCIIAIHSRSIWLAATCAALQVNGA